MNRALSVAATALAVAGIAACSGPDVNPVPAAEVASEIADRFEEETGTRPDVICPQDLEARRGAELTCEFTAGSPPQTFEVRVTVDSVSSDGTVVFDLVDSPKDVTPTADEDSSPAPAQDATPEETSTP